MDERWTRRVLTIFLVALVVWVATSVVGVFGPWLERLNSISLYVGLGALLALLAQALVATTSDRRQG